MAFTIPSIMSHYAGVIVIMNSIKLIIYNTCYFLGEGWQPLKPRKIKPPFCLFSYPPGGFKGAKLCSQQKVPFQKIA